WIFLSITSIICLTGITLWCLRAHPSVSYYGEQFIIDEWHLMPFIQFKPITLMVYLGFLAWAFFLEGVEDRLRSAGEDFIKFVMVLSALISFGSLYELFFNFSLWGALMAVTDVANPDALANSFPTTETTVSLVYASKLVLLVFATSTYTSFFILRIFWKRCCNQFS
ncbi:MAG: hypothetical protein ACP5K1_03995, partial [Candidatus Bathyarchaeia archaeon]